MPVTTANTIKFSDVCLEIYGSSSTLGKSLIQAHTDATGTFDPAYDTFGTTKTLLDFRGYSHNLVLTLNGCIDNGINPGA